MEETPSLVKTSVSGLMVVGGHRNISKRRVAFKASVIMDFVSEKNYKSW